MYKKIGKIEVAKRIECCVLTPGISCKMVITSQVLVVTDNLCPVMLQQVSFTRLDTQFSIENVCKNVSIQLQKLNNKFSKSVCYTFNLLFLLFQCLQSSERVMDCLIATFDENVRCFNCYTLNLQHFLFK